MIDNQMSSPLGATSEPLKTKYRAILEGQFSDEPHDSLPWNSLYVAAKYLYDKDDSGESDILIMKALERAHRGGMNLRNDRASYLDGVLMLTSLHMKYGQYYRAINYYSEARDNGAHLPDWAQLAYATAMIYAYPGIALRSPNGFLAALCAVDLNVYEIRLKAEAAVRRYLDQGTQEIVHRGMVVAEQTLLKLAEAFRNLGFDSLAEWVSFEHLAQTGELVPSSPVPNEAEEEYPDEVRHVVRIEQLQDQLQALVERVRQLEEENATLREQAVHPDRTSEPAMQSAPIAAERPLANDCWITGRRRRLLVFGNNRVPVDKLRRYANAIGFPANDIDFRLDYDRNAGFNLNSLQYSSPYVGILVGPNAHSMVGLGDHTSMIRKLRAEPGYPFSVEITTLAGELKITKSSFESALRKMMDHLNAVSV